MFDFREFTDEVRTGFNWLRMPSNPSRRTSERMVHEASDALDIYYDSHDWVMNVDADTLHMSSVDRCVIAQLFGRWINAPEELRSMAGFGPYIVDTENGNLAAAWANYLYAEQRAYRSREFAAVTSSWAPVDHIAERHSHVSV